MQFKNIQLFPNPMGETLKISGINEEFGVCIFDMRGRKMVELMGQSEDVLVTTTYFESGFYYVSIKTVTGQHTFKILK